MAMEMKGEKVENVEKIIREKRFGLKKKCLGFKVRYQLNKVGINLKS